uniref:Uncharacterized protein n=1 Tax=Meloidogyne floridensis TaxID=298350 RepID=A0A915NEU5_9BILA
MFGQLGNQMFRFASLYAIGQVLNRTPIYDYNESQMLIIDNELKETFPNFHSRIYYLKKDLNLNYTKKQFSRTCCEYVNPNIKNTSYKICVHTRVGDFKGNGETKIEEINKIMENLQKFLKNYLSTIVNKIYYILEANMSRGEELNFASQNCDIFISTAPTSTFAFWMAY